MPFFYLINMPNQLRFFAGLGAAMLLPAILGYIFRGGPVFHFMGYHICNNRGEPANKVICAVRAALSWMPILAFFGVMTLLLVVQENPEAEPGSLAHDLKHNPAASFGLAMTFCGSALITVVGVMFALFSPVRGIVDLLVRTRILPR